jgi:3-hydroxyacyl-[acyl-carrier-protein] dehydratase
LIDPISFLFANTMAQDFHHNFDRVEDYLHHRSPYLLVDRVVAVESKQIETEKVITGEEFFLPGHFPGVSIFPGAMMQEMTTQSAGILIAARYNPMKEYNTHDPKFNPFALGVLVRVTRAKFQGFARPGDVLRATVVLNERFDTIFDFSATLRVGDRVIMKNQFRLANIPTEALYGHDA